MNLRTRLLFVMLILSSGVFAQNRMELVLKKAESKESFKYRVTDFNYSLSRYPIMADTSANSQLKQEINISLSLKGKTDKFLLQWMADPESVIEGVLTIKDSNTGAVEKNITFSGSNSLMVSESYRTDEDPYGNMVSLNFATKKMAIEGIEIKSK